MVRSNLNERLTYPESTAVFAADKNKELTVYETKIYSIQVSICVGKVQKNYSSYGVLYAPIYLVKPNNRVTGIGVYEFRVAKFKYLKDETGEEELAFAKLPKPLWYTFATIDYISGILDGLEQHQLDIDTHVLTALQEKEKQADEFERILKQELEEKKTKEMASYLRNQFDLSSSAVSAAVSASGGGGGGGGSAGGGAGPGLVSPSVPSAPVVFPQPIYRRNKSRKNVSSSSKSFFLTTP